MAQHYAVGSTAVSEAPEPPAIDAITTSSGNVTVTWSGTAVLEAADAPTGPFSPVSGAASPYSANTSPKAQRFFRLSR